MNLKGATPVLLLLATMSLVLALILTAVGLQVGGEAEEILLELPPVNDVASNGNIVVAPAGAPANCGATTSDEWKVDVSMPEQLVTIKRVEVFMRFAPGPPPVDNMISARLDGGLVSVNAPPESPFLTWTSISEDHGDGTWIAFDFPDHDLDVNQIAFMIRSRAGHETSAWDASSQLQGALRGYCAGASDAAWIPSSVQLAVRMYGSLRGSSTGGGGSPDLFTRISPIFFATSAFLYAIALVPGKHMGLTFIEALILAVGAYFAWAYLADAIQAALGGGP